MSLSPWTKNPIRITYYSLIFAVLPFLKSHLSVYNFQKFSKEPDSHFRTTLINYGLADD